MVFRASKDFQGRLVIADLQATTGLQGTHIILMSMAMDLLFQTMIHLLCLHLQA